MSSGNAKLRTLAALRIARLQKSSKEIAAN